MKLFTKTKNVETGLTRLHNLLTYSFRNVQKDTQYILHWLTYLYNKNLHQEQLISELREELNYTPRSKEEIREIVDEYYSYEPLLNRIKELDSRIAELKESHIDLQKSNRELKKIPELDSKIDDLRQSHLALHKSHTELHQRHYEQGSEFDTKIAEIGPKLDAKIDAKIEELKERLEAQKEVQKQVVSLGQPIKEVDELSKRLEKLEARKATIKEKIIKRITKNSRDYVKAIVLSYIKKYGKITAMQLKDMVVEEQGLCSKSSFYRMLEEIEEEPDIGIIKKGKEKHYIAKIQSKNY